MATNYTKFCVALPSGQEFYQAAENILLDVSAYFAGEEHSLSEELIGAIEDGGLDDELGFLVDFDGDTKDVVVFSQEYGSVAVAATLISDILEAANSDAVIVLDYALTSSRIQTDAYGGGSAAISRSDVQYFDPSSMARKAAEEMKQALSSSPAP